MEDVKPIISQLEKAHGGLVATVGTVPDERWRSSPGGGAWSAGEVIAHLTMVETSVINGAEKVLSAAPRPVPLLKRFHVPVVAAKWRIRKVKSPIPLDPNLVKERPAMMDEFGKVRERTLKFIEQNRGRDLSPYRFPHPFFGSLNVYDWLRILANHEVRHTKQIREMVELFQR